MDDFDNERTMLTGDFKINLGSQNLNFITASVAVVVDSYSFIFVAFIDPSGDSFIIGVRRTGSVYVDMTMTCNAV